MKRTTRLHLTVLALSCSLAGPALADEVMSAEDIAYQLLPKRGITATTSEPASVDLSTVTFEFNSADLTPQARRQLDEVLEELADIREDYGSQRSCG